MKLVALTYCTSFFVGKFKQQQSMMKAAKEEKAAAVAEEPKPLVVDSSVPFVKRPFKVHLLRAFLTQFDGS